LLGFTIDREVDRDMQSLQQIINERISFLKEQINPQNKSEENKTFQLQIDAIRAATAAISQSQA
jgi:phosphoserine aminotransferase